MTTSIERRYINNKAREEKLQRDARATARRSMGEHGSPEMKTAVKLAEAGYGYEDIMAKTRVSKATARLLVLGI